MGSLLYQCKNTLRCRYRWRPWCAACLSYSARISGSWPTECGPSSNWFSIWWRTRKDQEEHRKRNEIIQRNMSPRWWMWCLLLVVVFDGASDFDLSAFEDGGFAAYFQRHLLFRLALLYKVLIGRLDFRQVRCRWRPLWSAADSCCLRFFLWLFRNSAALLASVARLRFGRPRRRIAMIGRFGQHLTQGQQLLARHFAHLEASIARRRTLWSKSKQNKCNRLIKKRDDF